MKKIFIITAILINVFFANAQITLSLSVNARPMANISMWSTRADMLALVANLPTGNPISCKINTTISEVGGGVIATTNLQAAPVVQVRNGANIFYAKDVLNSGALVFSDGVKSKLSKSGQLPAGTYQITTRMVEVSQPLPISNAQDKVFTIAPTVLPILIKPYNNEVLNKTIAQSAITFRWSPITPSVGVSYRLTVFEVLPNQTPTQAIRANMPLLDKNIERITQYVWNTQLLFTDSSRSQLVWTVQSLDAQGNPVVGENPSGQGISEPVTFYIGEKPKAIVAIKTEEN